LLALWVGLVTVLVATAWLQPLQLIWQALALRQRP